MKEHSLTIDLGTINFMPATVEEEVLLNIRTLLTTAKGTVPMDRNFGVTMPQDEPLPGAREKLNVEIIDAIERYEPRAKVINVRWSANAGSAPARSEASL